jgi:NADP-dependent 3-hydroxy acid dehydrogenase YdfG
LHEQATAEAFAQASAKSIILVGRRFDAIAAVRDELSSRYPDCNVVAHSCDVSQTNEVNALFAKLKEEGEIDVLVNNAGVSLSVSAVKDSDVEAWWKTFVSAFSLFTLLIEALICVVNRKST